MNAEEYIVNIDGNEYKSIAKLPAGNTGNENKGMRISSENLDKDKVGDVRDNCKYIPSFYQLNSDGMGDACNNCKPRQT